MTKAKNNYLLIGPVDTRLIEECSELIHALCKAQRFGVDHSHPYEEKSNRERIIDEINDVERLIAEWRAKYD